MISTCVGGRLSKRVRDLDWPASNPFWIDAEVVPISKVRGRKKLSGNYWSWSRTDVSGGLQRGILYQRSRKTEALKREMLALRRHRWSHLWCLLDHYFGPLAQIPWSGFIIGIAKNNFPQPLDFLSENFDTIVGGIVYQPGPGTFQITRTGTHPPCKQKRHYRIAQTNAFMANQAK